MAIAMPTSGGDEPEEILDINTTPLIDVMLVLLVMLIITIPIQLHAVKLELPVAHTAANPVKPELIRIDIDASNQIFWQGEAVSTDKLDEYMRNTAQLQPQPDLHLRTDKNASYTVFADVLAASRRQGLTRIAVVGAEQFAP